MKIWDGEIFYTTILEMQTTNHFRGEDIKTQNRITKFSYDLVILPVYSVNELLLSSLRGSEVFFCLLVFLPTENLIHFEIAKDHSYYF